MRTTPARAAATGGVQDVARSDRTPRVDLSFPHSLSGSAPALGPYSGCGSRERVRLTRLRVSEVGL